MSREGYEEIVRYFVSIVDRIPESKWGGHGLGEWSLRDLVGHASRAVLTVDMYTKTRSRKPVTGNKPRCCMPTCWQCGAMRILS